MKIPVVLPIVLLASLCTASVAAAQSADSRIEIAAQASVLRLSDFDTTNAGFGGRVSYDLTRWVAVEGEVNFFPRDRIAGPESMTSVGPFRFTSSRRRTDALFGVRVGARGERLGAFVKARPGLTHLTDKGSGCVGPGCAVVLMLVAPTIYRTEFAFDVGGGIEFFPTSRTVARAEVGDTIIRHRSTALPCVSADCTSHNLSSRFGLGFRF